jgi:hypothetical protein
MRRADGFDPNRRNRGRFIANIDTDDDRCWVPYIQCVPHYEPAGELDALIR